MKIAAINFVNNKILNQRKRVDKQNNEKSLSNKNIDKLPYSQAFFQNSLSFGSNFNAKDFLAEMIFENCAKEYYIPKEIDGEVKYSFCILPNKEAMEKLAQLDNLTRYQKSQFVDEFCKMTGFPNLDKVSKNIENEAISAICTLAQKEDFDVQFIGYDSNCSTGRKISLPGSDCDGLFMIIDTKEHEEPWYAGKIRWDFKDFVNQRILSTPANHLPEVLDLDFINTGLKLAQDAFDIANFSESDLERFQENLFDNTNDFVKSAEFNVRLAQNIPNVNHNREIYYKTAMLAEIIRDGIVCKNDFDEEMQEKILNSCLYKYSNLMKQKGLSSSFKHKYILRSTLEKDFYRMSLDEQFNLIKDILYYSFNQVRDNENKKYFSNMNGANDAMGNINEMYALMLN